MHLFGSRPGWGAQAGTQAASPSLDQFPAFLPLGTLDSVAPRTSTSSLQGLAQPGRNWHLLMAAGSGEGRRGASAESRGLGIQLLYSGKAQMEKLRQRARGLPELLRTTLSVPPRVPGRRSPQPFPSPWSGGEIWFLCVLVSTLTPQMLGEDLLLSEPYSCVQDESETTQHGGMTGPGAASVLSPQVVSTHQVSISFSASLTVRTPSWSLQTPWYSAWGLAQSRDSSIC